LSHGYCVVDRTTGKGRRSRIWETEEALQASSVKADELRARGTGPSDSSIVSVEGNEIVQTVGSPS
jgi:hypothetical protein